MMVKTCVNDEIKNSIKQKALEYIWQCGTSKQKILNNAGPVIFERGEGCYLYDISGKKYLDGVSGVWVVNAGHGQKTIIDSIVQQHKVLSYALSEEGYSNKRAVELGEKLCSILPGEMKRVYFTCGGSEAVEIALRFARLFHRVSGNLQKKKIVSRQGSYHGATLLALTVSGFELFHELIGPVPDGIRRIPHPYCYRCKHNPLDCACLCADELEKLIQREGPETVAAFIAEPISIFSGVAIPPGEYWQKIRNICNKYEVLLISDEVATGFGRTGKLFGLEHFGINPDIVIMSKGLTSGYMPLGAVAMNRKVTEGIPDNTFLLPGYTYTGHPACCAAALANIDLIINNQLVQNAEKVGTYIVQALKEKLSENPFVGDIRGKGLLICVEIVQDREKKKPFLHKREIDSFLTRYFLQKGLYLRVIGGYIYLGPPLIITEDEAEIIIEEVSLGINKLSCFVN